MIDVVRRSILNSSITVYVCGPSSTMHICPPLSASPSAVRVRRPPSSAAVKQGKLVTLKTTKGIVAY
ncbi:hypothetical protein ACS0TY_032820 [Phlomoides rotata]